MDSAYVYRHVVGFEETNLVGNVYYTNHLRWQGRCRELFLRDHAASVVGELARGLALVTVRVACDYLAELTALDAVEVHMRLSGRTQNRLSLLFEYWCVSREPAELVARGEQQVACMRRDGPRLLPAPIPEALLQALRIYSDTPALLS
jgi:enediyne core biosynthesis thioesterase